METIYDMITTNPAKAINIKDFELKVGAPAHLVVLDAKSVHEAFWYHKPPLHVVSHGKLVDRRRWSPTSSRSTPQAKLRRCAWNSADAPDESADAPDESAGAPDGKVSG